MIQTDEIMQYNKRSQIYDILDLKQIFRSSFSTIKNQWEKSKEWKEKKCTKTTKSLMSKKVELCRSFCCGEKLRFVDFFEVSKFRFLIFILLISSFLFLFLRFYSTFFYNSSEQFYSLFLFCFLFVLIFFVFFFLIL